MPSPLDERATIERVHTMGIVGHFDISPPGQCQVMFCIATEHNGGTQHYDGTGASFVSCVHGNLSQWDPCEHCGFGTDDFPDKIGFLLDRLTREFRKTATELRLWQRQPEQDEISRAQVEYAKVALHTLRVAIGTAVRVRLGENVDVFAAEIAPTGTRYLDSIPKAGR